MKQKIILFFHFYRTRKLKFLLVCDFLLPCLWFLIALKPFSMTLLNWNLATTCKTDHLVCFCRVHRHIKNKGCNGNTCQSPIELFIFIFYLILTNTNGLQIWTNRLSKIWYVPVCQFSPCSNKKSCFICTWPISRFRFAHLELRI